MLSAILFFFLLLIFLVILLMVLVIELVAEVKVSELRKIKSHAPCMGVLRMAAFFALRPCGPDGTES